MKHLYPWLYGTFHSTCTTVLLCACSHTTSLCLTWGTWIWLMDHLVNKELAAWVHSKGCSQWLCVQVETSDKWWSSGTGCVLDAQGPSGWKDLIFSLCWRFQFRTMLRNSSQVHLNALASWINFQAVLRVLKETLYLKEVFAHLLDDWDCPGKQCNHRRVPVEEPIHISLWNSRLAEAGAVGCGSYVCQRC